MDLLALPSPLPPQPQHQGSGDCEEWRGFVSGSAHSCSLPHPLQAGLRGDCIPVLALTLPLLTVLARIIPFWDAPYLFLITAGTQIELFSMSSKEVPYTLD